MLKSILNVHGASDNYLSYIQYGFMATYIINRELKSYKHIFPMQTNEFIQIRIHFIAVYINILIEYGLIDKCKYALIWVYQLCIQITIVAIYT